MCANSKLNKAYCIKGHTVTTATPTIGRATCIPSYFKLLKKVKPDKKI